MNKCKVIAFINQKGGVGKTTTTQNIGVALAKLGKKVLLIDCDSQANLTESFGYQNPDELEFTISDIYENFISKKEYDYHSLIVHTQEEVDLLPANIALAGIEHRLSTTISREYILKKYLDVIKDDYDYVLIDCMPSLGIININAMAAADSVIIPSQPQYYSAKGLEMLMQSISMVKEDINPDVEIEGIVMTMVSVRTNIHKQMIELIRNAYGADIKLFNTVIPYSSKASKPSAFGESLIKHDPAGKLALAYSNLALEILENEQQRA